ncbi:MAG TPA: 2-C-methyl-D-erythritol 4-phosphate cytidylyltransferase [Nitrospiria bacterium]|jgi:2-C-methyl-D-erythritol 4-phosphate cytidylyltransferase|nr:2-C-methyl-D-erythritol 4-phosphate cytidylyltransferase [Nitrospiria bacterium]
MKRGNGERLKVTAIVPAAGSGLRMKGNVPKQFLLLDGLPILAHTLRALEPVPQIDEVILVVPESQISFCRTEIVNKYNLKKISKVIPGGEQRQDSVYKGLQAVSADTDWVMVHDGVRPFVTQAMIESAIEAAKEAKDGAVVAIPMRDTPKEVLSNRITKTLDRQRLWLAQTPQVFRRSLFLRAHEEARSQGIYGTDDAALVERLGGCVQIALGSEENIKVTTPADLELAEAIIATRRTTGHLPAGRTGGPKKGSA